VRLIQKIISLLIVSSAITCFAQEAFDAELRESISRADVTVTDYYSRTETKPVVITTFRPPGDGKFPLLILNHGRAVESKRSLQGRARYLLQVRWLVEQGFVVMIPTRIGYGETYSSFDPEFTNACRGANLAPMEDAIFRQLTATLEFAKTQPYVDASKWLIAGQSAGGYAAISVSRKSPEGLVGAINFAGGFGGDPDGRKGNSCNHQVWEDSLKKKNSDTTPPTLWLYWKDDWYWGNEIPKKWFTAFKLGGGIGDFVHFNEIKGDGHLGFSKDIKNWTKAVQQFLSSLPIRLTPVELKKASPIPPPTGFAAVSEIEKIPHLSETGREGYRNFLLKDSPRAFALNTDGKWGWSSGHWDTSDRAIAYCNKNAKKPCSLYAFDDDVVWSP
jgi:dienelactone hydrolase